MDGENQGVEAEDNSFCASERHNVLASYPIFAFHVFAVFSCLFSMFAYSTI
jgi:hypothetical protein